MARAVGLDLGTRLLKLVELSGSAKSFKVQRFAVAPVSGAPGEEGDLARVEQIRELFAEHRLPKDDVCASFQAGTTIFRDVNVPFKDDAQIQKTIRFEAENHLHGRAIEDVVVNWVRTGDTVEGSQVIVMAAPKQELAQRLGLLRRAGIDAASVDLDATALYTACEATGVFAEHPSCVVLDVGARTTGLLLVDGGRPKAVRAFLVGSEALATAVGQDLELPPGDAGARALGSGGDAGALLVRASSAVAVQPPKETEKGVQELEEDAVAQRREEYVRKIHREVMRSITAARGAEPPSLVLLCGGGSLVPGLPEALSERLGIPVQPLKILERLGWAPQGEDPRLEEAVAPVAIGCALRVLGRNPLGVELRRDEFAPSNTFEVVRRGLVVFVTALVVGLAALAFVTKSSRDREQDLYLRTISSHALTVYLAVETAYQQKRMGLPEDQAKAEAKRLSKTLPNDSGYLPAVRAHLIRRYRELEENLGLSKDVPPIESALKVMREIYASLGEIPRKELGFFRINKMSIQQNQASVTIEIDDERTVDKVERALNTNAYLKGRSKNPNRVAEGQNMQKNQQTNRFTVTIDLNFEEAK